MSHKHGVALSSIDPVPLDWLWRGWIPRGKLVTLDGDPDVGKSLITIDIATRIANGDVMPDGSQGVQGAAVMIGCEDDAADTVRPRFDAAGWNGDGVLMLSNVGQDVFTVPRDVEVLREAIMDMGAIIAVVDPISAHLSEKVNAYVDGEVRRAMAPLGILAQETGCTILAARHMTKGTTGKALYRGQGSIGMVGVARAGLMAARDPDDENRRILAAVKMNLAERPQSRSYSFEISAYGVPRVIWGDTTGYTADQLTAPFEAPSRLQEAKNFLKSELATGSCGAKELLARAEGVDISEKTLRRASREIGIKPTRTAFGGPWIWSLPIEATKNVSPPELTTFGSGWPSTTGTQPGTDDEETVAAEVQRILTSNPLAKPDQWVEPLRSALRAEVDRRGDKDVL